MTDAVTIFEVGPRDGLQNEARLIPAADKINLVNMLSDSGFSKIEVTSFVSPKWVPQLADAGEVLDGITRKDDVCYAALTPNIKGFEAALAKRVDEVAIFGAASESFSQKNINCSISESLTRFQPVMDLAKKKGIPVRGYVSCVIDCPYEGAVRPDTVASVAKALFEMGCYEVSLGDTTGVGHPEAVATMLDAVLDVMPATRLAGHYHDTGGRAIDNIRVSLGRGLRVFDSSIAGLGGCPYAPGAKGNVATEAVVDMLEAEGISTGVDQSRLPDVARFAASLRGRA